MKIDSEGWETRILCGGQSLFTRNDAPVIQVEFADKNAAAAGTSCRELRQVLEQFGYRLFRYNAHTNTLKEEPAFAAYPRTVNLIAIKEVEEVYECLGNIVRY